ncbi:MAG: conjugal transfer protein [Mycolicibacterium sp.]|uniref:hypothetical protein n=1 Tax=Mycolicibacterium sp. TaxID=2320850 RepID=UPI003D0F99FC
MWRSEIARSATTQYYHRYVWFLAWPLILMALFSSCGGHSVHDAGPDATVKDQVTTYGATAILSFITASPADAAELTAIFGELIKPPAGQQSIPLPHQTVLASFASAKQQGKSDDWLVELTAITTDGPTHWQVPVRVSSSRYRVTQLPGITPGLPTGPAVAVNAAAPVDVNSDAPVSVTLRDFFTAWLTGTGDLGRVADTTAVQRFATPPFTRVKVMEAYAGAQIPQQPQGDLTVGVVVWGMNTQTTQSSYTLKLTASAGRWVVSDVAAQPSVRTENTSSTSPAGP